MGRAIGAVVTGYATMFAFGAVGVLLGGRRST